MGDQFDSVMNYPVTKACVQFFAMQKDNAQDFADNLSGFLMWNSEQVNFAMLNLLDSQGPMQKGVAWTLVFLLKIFKIILSAIKYIFSVIKL